jgi:methyltransferase (TIGR00027 family)
MSDVPSAPPLSAVHRSAIGAAAMRAAHLLDAAEPKIFRDEFAMALAGLSDAQVRFMAQVLVGINGADAEAGWVLRSRYAEDELARLGARVSQYVVLGAGLDSFALRHAARLGELRVFEVDDPPMLAWKRDRLSALGIVAPPQLRFAPCDFETTEIAAALAAVGFGPLPTFATWLGVTPYLSRPAIDRTLRWASTLPPGSSLLLTFVVAGPQADALKEKLTPLGLQFATFFTPLEMTRQLVAAGFESIRHLAPAEADAVYFAGRTDGLRAPTLERLVVATTG